MSQNASLSRKLRLEIGFQRLGLIIPKLTQMEDQKPTLTVYTIIQLIKKLRASKYLLLLRWDMHFKRAFVGGWGGESHLHILFHTLVCLPMRRLTTDFLMQGTEFFSSRVREELLPHDPLPMDRILQ